MENFVKQHVKTYKTVNKLIAENITKEEILEFLNSGEGKLSDWWLDKNSCSIFETYNKDIYICGIVDKNTSSEKLELHQTDDVINFISELENID